jgi:hypothetical protein
MLLKNAILMDSPTPKRDAFNFGESQFDFFLVFDGSKNKSSQMMNLPSEIIFSPTAQ